MFKRFLEEKENEDYEWYSVQVEEYIVHVWYKRTGHNLITEAKHKGLPLGGQYSAQLHKPPFTVGQQHIHVYANNNQLFALNKDGSAHDQSRGIRIPNKVAKAISNEFPDFILPSANIIESAPMAIQLLYDLQIANESSNS